jgi:plasmid maintenance system antidote protein VapI
MELKNKTRLLNELAKSVETPWEFVGALIALEGLTSEEAADRIGISRAHLHVLKNGKGIGMRVGVKISNAFGIDPIILNRIQADYNLKNFLKKKDGTNKNTEGEIPD